MPQLDVEESEKYSSVRREKIHVHVVVDLPSTASRAYYTAGPVTRLLGAVSKELLWQHMIRYNMYAKIAFTYHGCSYAV